MAMLYLKRLKILLPLFCLVSLMSTKTNALVSKEEAIRFVIDSIIGPDTVHVWAYINPDSLPRDTVIRGCWGHGNPYSNPYEWSWFFFIDDQPPANWAHFCRYVFIEYPHIGSAQSYMAIYEMTPPDIYDSLEMIWPSGVKENSNSSGLSKTLKFFSNPFTQRVYMEYQLSRKSYVSLRIYDILGRLVKKLVDGEQELGYHRICWDRTDDEGVKVSSGTYLCKLTFNDTKVVKLVVLH